MPLTNDGAEFIANRIFADTLNVFDNTNAAIGVGSSSTAFSAAQSDLQATTYGTNKDKKGMEATYPQLSTNQLTFRSLFGTSEANYAWEEWGVFNFTGETAPNGSTEVMLNRKVESLGTKTSAQSWQITVTITVSAT